MAVTFDESRITVLDHPLVHHKMHLLRAENTNTMQTRSLVRELTVMLAYEATRDLPLEDVPVHTPVADTIGKRIAGKKLSVIPILRAGMGMMEGVLDLIPAAHVGVLGMQRNEVTHEPEWYYDKLPVACDERVCLLVDPMLATGGSIKASVEYLRNAGTNDIRVLTLVSAPEGVKAVTEADPDVHIWTCALDQGLNENAYIVPGLGDAGDRIFGTLGA